LKVTKNQEKEKKGKISEEEKSLEKIASFRELQKIIEL